jgi:hypothetical protein
MYVKEVCIIFKKVKIIEKHNNFINLSKISFQSMSLTIIELML